MTSERFRLKVVTYNIDGREDRHKDARLLHQLRRLADLEPHILGLQECKEWQRDGWATQYWAEDILGTRVPS
ncbi:hypothetical protein ETD86_29535 [Nonomuraea turkmeniaca]|uniref:Endonuclease n=1 Tax=Nonomuraea turkmeniaca TaxID=103838 RepID=A0A5S4FUU5_9ACTN|nr:hypothetical protein [Nonomuraea turkmeniaca]TMR14090.1 hypothetical protein ETD86_29535 [Nonomuraea turkmeniaca]